MILQATFRDFKLLRDVQIDLGRFNVIVGRNGIGKSTLLDGLHLLLQLAVKQEGEDAPATRRPELIFRDEAAPGRLVSAPNGTSFCLAAHTNDELSLTVEGTPQAEPRKGSFRVRLGRVEGHTHYEHPPPVAALWGRKAPTSTKTPDVTRLYGTSTRLRLHAPTLARDAYAEQVAPQLAADGAGLASVLQYLSGLRDGTIEAIEADMARVVPEFRRIRALPTKITARERVRITVDGQESWVDQVRDLTGARFEVELADIGWTRADQLSEGTLLALGLVTVARHRPPNLLLLDDIDKALHPVAQRELVKLLKALQQQNPALQIIATSHSPFVLDELDATEVFVMGADGPGRSRVCRLDAHPTWPKRGQYMHPGEFWSVVGEGWVGQGTTP